MQQLRRAEAEAALEAESVRHGLPELHEHAGRLTRWQKEAAVVHNEPKEYWDDLRKKTRALRRSREA